MVCCARAMLPPSIITALAPARFRTAVWGQRVFGFAASFFMTVGATSPITATAAKNAVVRGVMISDRDFSDASSNPACATTIIVHNPRQRQHALRHPCNHRLRTWQLRKLYGMRPMATPTANCGRGTCSWGDATFMNQLGVKGNTRAKIMYTVRCDRLASINLRNSTMREAKKRATCNGPHQCDKPRRYTHTRRAGVTHTAHRDTHQPLPEHLAEPIQEDGANGVVQQAQREANVPAPTKEAREGGSVRLGRGAENTGVTYMPNSAPPSRLANTVPGMANVCR